MNRMPIDQPTVTIKLNVKHLLEDRGMTQKELSQLSGITESKISALVRGYFERIQVSHLERLATVFEITDMNELFTIEVIGKKE